MRVACFSGTCYGEKMRDPFSPIFLGTLLVLAAGNLLPVEPSILPPLILIVFTAALILFFHRRYQTCYLGLLLSISLLILFGFLRQKEDFAAAREIRLPGNQYVTITGRLGDFPEIRGDSSILILDSRTFAFERRQIHAELTLRLRIQGDCSHLYRGDTLTLSASLSDSRPSRNFLSNPFENYSLYTRIHAGGYVKSFRLIERTRRTSWYWRWIGLWRNRIRDQIERKYASDGTLNERGVFLEATVLGDRGKLEISQKEDLIRSGVFHLIAISGANIGMIALLSLGLMKLFRVPFRRRYAVAALILVLFLVISGFDISAQRAVWMALLIFAARSLYLEIEIFNIVSLSGILILMGNPAQFLDPGFILTYALTATIILGRRLFLPWLRRIPSYLAEWFSANLSASLISLPLSLFFFHRYSFAAFFAGLVLIPLTTLITAAGVLLIPLSLFSQPLSQAILGLSDPLLAIFFTVTRFFSRRIDMSIFRPSPSPLLVLIVLLSFFLLARERLRLWIRIPLGLLFVLLLLALALPPPPYRPERLEAYFLDVGQGDCQVVVFPGGDGLMIDGGGSSFSDFEVGKTVVLPFLLDKRIKVRWMALSHYHPDHVRGLIELIGILNPEELWISSTASEDPFSARLDGARAYHCRLCKTESGFSRTIAGCRVRILYPPRFIDARFTANNHSQVIAVRDEIHSFLFTGDIESEAEANLVRSLHSLLAADVLKIGHHGSQSSSTLPFLRDVGPRLAVLSYGRRNRFGFPHPEVIRRLQKERIPWLSTARRGGIRVVSLPHRLEISVSE
jgi:competence protein ComEC